MTTHKLAVPAARQRTIAGVRFEPSKVEHRATGFAYRAWVPMHQREGSFRQTLLFKVGRITGGRRGWVACRASAKAPTVEATVACATTLEVLAKQLNVQADLAADRLARLDEYRYVGPAAFAHACQLVLEGATVTEAVTLAKQKKDAAIAAGEQVRDEMEEAARERSMARHRAVERIIGGPWVPAEVADRALAMHRTILETLTHPCCPRVTMSRFAHDAVLEALEGDVATLVAMLEYQLLEKKAAAERAGEPDNAAAWARAAAAVRDCTVRLRALGRLELPAA